MYVKKNMEIYKKKRIQKVQFSKIILISDLHWDNVYKTESQVKYTPRFGHSTDLYRLKDRTISTEVKFLICDVRETQRAMIPVMNVYD